MAESFPVDFGEYRLLKKVAQGGMAEIFLAQNSKGEILALKRILPHLAHEESFIRMFIDEARIVSHIQHGNVAQVYDQGKVGGYYYIAMEFVQGHSLLSLSERAKSMKIPLPRGLLAYVVAELLAGLGSAHSARDAKGRHLGIVHRDVTPQNVLISYDGEVKLIDFGVAKARARLTQTEAGFTKGKLSYMSPEQARGEELDSRSDLFSVGIVLYEITTNSRLFNKEGPGGILGAIVNDPIPPPTLRAKDFPKDLESVVMRALEKDVDRRWQSAEEMRDSLLRYAKKEKPPPGRARLKDLVHDLFGEPEIQKIIDAAKAVSAPTPAQVAAHKDSVVRGGSLRVKEEEIPVEALSAPADPVVGHRSVVQRSAQSRAEPAPDETRMLRPEQEALSQLSRAKSRAAERRLELTSEGTPILDLALVQDAPVPEPEVPQRVKVARFLRSLMSDLAVSWRERRARWLLGGAGVTLLLGLCVTWLVGGFAHLGSWLEEAQRRAREVRTSAGIVGEDFDAGARPTVLRLRSEPPGAAVAVDGFGTGHVTPHELTELTYGRPLHVELSLPGYRPKEEKLTLYPNSGPQEITLKLEKRTGRIRVESDPPGARVSLDGQLLEGTTPLTTPELTAEVAVKLVVSKGGRVAKSQTVTPGDGLESRVLLELPLDERAVPDGRVDISTSPAGCAITIDDQPAGRAPLKGRELRPGPHSARAECDNHAAETRAFTVTPGKTSELSFVLTPNVFGYLTIKPIPEEGSVVEVNGRRVPLPVEFLKVVPGRHNVVVMNAGLRSKKEVTVDVTPNGRVTRSVSLVQ